MHVRTYGKNDKISKKELRTAARFMAGLLISPQLLRNIWVHIYSTDKAIVIDGHPCDAKLVTEEDEPPRKFKIYIDTALGKRAQLICLAHELTHAKQYATGKNEPPEDWSGDYNFCPSEIESLGYEKALYEKYRETKK